MFAIAFLFFILLYLLISYLLALGISKLFPVKGIKKQTTKNIVFSFMIALVMWDWIPMEISYKYKCYTEAGLTVHKSIDEWQQENPGVAETLNPDPEKSLPESSLVRTEGLDRYYLLPDGTEIVAHYDRKKDYMYTVIKNNNDSRAYWLNQRFARDYVITQYWFHIYKQEGRVFDTKTNEILATYIDFETNIRPLGLGQEFKDFKFWMQKKSCEKGIWPNEQTKFNDYKQIIKNIGSN